MHATPSPDVHTIGLQVSALSRDVLRFTDRTRGLHVDVARASFAEAHQPPELESQSTVPESLDRTEEHGLHVVERNARVGRRAAEHSWNDRRIGPVDRDEPNERLNDPSGTVGLHFRTDSGTVNSHLEQTVQMGPMYGFTLNDWVSLPVSSRAIRARSSCAFCVMNGHY